MTDPRQDAPAFHRNHVPITAELKRLLGDSTGNVLEVGSGTGQHIVKFAAALPNLTWWPTEPDPARRDSIAAYRGDAGLPNVRPPTDLDATGEWRLGAPNRPPTGLSAILSLNVIHIAPWTVAEHLIENAAHHLRTGGRLILYGPFAKDGTHTAPSNAAFDTQLRAQNPAWGVRDLQEVMALAANHNLLLTDTVTMPANNLTVAFARK